MDGRLELQAVKLTKLRPHRMPHFEGVQPGRFAACTLYAALEAMGLQREFTEFSVRPAL